MFCGNLCSNRAFSAKNISTAVISCESNSAEWLKRESIYRDKLGLSLELWRIIFPKKVTSPAKVKKKFNDLAEMDSCQLGTKTRVSWFFAKVNFSVLNQREPGIWWLKRLLFSTNEVSTEKRGERAIKFWARIGLKLRNSPRQKSALSRFLSELTFNFVHFP